METVLATPVTCQVPVFYIPSELFFSLSVKDQQHQTFGENQYRVPGTLHSRKTISQEK